MLLLGTTTNASAQTYPTRPVKIVLPFAAGSPTDAVLRVISAPLSKRLGQPVIVDNKPGATGMLGTEFVAKAQPDGYTLLFGTNTTRLGLRRGTYLRRFEYDFIELFAPQLGRKAVDMAMAGTGNQDEYQL